mmetsp:Transcript_8980/g.18137  ORF Transcript_8980/g.18137 Transcript_8980/m.18137 type:complete len:469 (+) Transcript_8980:106-1512(+)
MWLFSQALFLGLLALAPSKVHGDFVFPDFNKTTGLQLNGVAATTSCEVGIDLTEKAGFKDLHGISDPYGMRHGKADNFSQTSYEQLGEKSTMQTKRTVETNNETGTFSDSIKDMTSTFGHRDDFVDSKTTRCATRVRLTPSTPSTSGSVFFTNRLPVLQGFDTKFEFQVSDHSRTCTQHMDPGFGLVHHTTCAVHGGDGLAFVIHGDATGPSSLGGDGSELGYGGISNGIAVEFDMWTNVASIHAANDDIFSDHISIHSNGAGVLTTESTSALGGSRAHDLADGAIHVARVLYLPYIEPKYFERMSASSNLVQYMKDNGEGRRLGTLAVFIDSGIDNDVPILSIPINLSVLLELDQGMAYAGFTGSTGKKWEKHDLLRWQWCDFGNCKAGTPDSNLFDYHSQSKFYTARHTFNHPGNGYGGSQQDSPPTRHGSPDSEPWGEDNSRKASGFSDGLYSGAAGQVPPHTLD